MIAVVILLVILVPILTMVFIRSRRESVGPLNLSQENRLPEKTTGGNDEFYAAMLYLASWTIEKNARGRKVKIDLAVEQLVAQFSKDTQEVRNDLSRALVFSTNIRSLTNWIRRYSGEVQKREEILSFMLNIAFCDGDIIDREYVAIARFCELIGIRLERLAREIHARRDDIYVNGDFPEFDNGSFFRRKALHTLGLTMDADADMIKKAYRKLVNELHPDKFTAAEHSDDPERQARFLAVRDAYEFLLRK